MREKGKCATHQPHHRRVALLAAVMQRRAARLRIPSQPGEPELTPPPANHRAVRKARGAWPARRAAIAAPGAVGEGGRGRGREGEGERERTHPVVGVGVLPAREQPAHSQRIAIERRPLQGRPWHLRNRATTQPCSRRCPAVGISWCAGTEKPPRRALETLQSAPEFPSTEFPLRSQVDIIESEQLWRETRSLRENREDESKNSKDGQRAPPLHFIM